MNIDEIPIGLMLRRAYFSMRRNLETGLSPLNMTPEQYGVLFLLKDSQEMKQKDLAEQLFSDPNTIVGIVKRLLSKGWIERRRDPKDGRASCILLSETGKLKLQEALKISSIVRQAALKQMSEQDVDKLSTLLRQLHSNFLEHKIQINK